MSFPEKVDLFISATSLPNVQLAGVSDPFIVVYSKNTIDNKLVKIAYTQSIKDDLNPVWAQAITVDYIFEAVQEIIVHVFHQSAGYGLEKLENHTKIGEACFTLASLMKHRKQKLSLNIELTRNPIIPPANSAVLHVQGEVQVNIRDSFVAEFSATNLSNKTTFFGKSSPLFLISRKSENGDWTAVHRSQRIFANLNPRWPVQRINMTTLCNGDYHRPLRIEILDLDAAKNTSSMGYLETSVKELMEKNEEPFEMTQPELRGQISTLKVFNIKIEKLPQFIDYVAGGCEISLMVAIDFTASNLYQTLPDSLHYIDARTRPGASTAIPKPPTSGYITSSNDVDASPQPPNATAMPLFNSLSIDSPPTLNPYQKAIMSIGAVLEPYDTDKLYPVYGFGANLKLPDGSFTPCQHCFPAYSDGRQVHGVAGILQAYYDCLERVKLSGPTLFSEIIKEGAKVAKEANCSQSNQKYIILLIITDGCINDLDQTKKLISECSTLPLSIVVVGVGSEDFSDMKELDDNILNVGRDIVQFVPFDEMSNRGNKSLAAEVLAEIPDQFLWYMNENKLLPNNFRNNASSSASSETTQAVHSSEQLTSSVVVASVKTVQFIG